jgi:hypothetical protein
LASLRFRLIHAKKNSTIQRAPPQRGEADLIGPLADDLDDDGGGHGDARMIVSGIGEDTFDEGDEGTRGVEQPPAAVAVLDARRVRLQQEAPPVGVPPFGRCLRPDRRMALAPVDLLAGVIPARPASMVLTLWLWPSADLWSPMLAADGLASRPTRSRSAMTRAWLIFSNMPSSRHAANQRSTVLHGGTSEGRRRQAMPPRMT